MRGRRHEPLGNGHGKRLFVRNDSRYPDVQVKALVKLAAEPFDARGAFVRVKNRRRGACSGTAYPEAVWSKTTPASAEFTVVVSVGEPGRFPSSLPIRKAARRPNGAAREDLHDWQEALVAVAAHEFAHVEQFKEGLPRSEVKAERAELQALDRFRAQRHNRPDEGRKEGDMPEQTNTKAKAKREYPPELVKRLKADRKKGLSTGKIAEGLNADKVACPTGRKEWNARAVHHVLWQIMDGKIGRAQKPATKTATAANGKGKSKPAQAASTPQEPVAGKPEAKPDPKPSAAAK